MVGEDIEHRAGSFEQVFATDHAWAKRGREQSSLLNEPGPRRSVPVSSLSVGGGQAVQNGRFCLIQVT